MIARHVFFEGRVQGVGFRFTVKQIARGYDVVGSVRNLEDGRVELLCSGEEEEVDGFLKAIAESELASHIENTRVNPMVAVAGARGFEIVS